MADSAADRRGTLLLGSTSSNINTYDLDTEMSGITSHCPVIVHAEDHTDRRKVIKWPLPAPSLSAMLIPSRPSRPPAPPTPNSQY